MEVRLDQPELLVDAARHFGENIGGVLIAEPAASSIALRAASPKAASAAVTAVMCSLSPATPSS